MAASLRVYPLPDDSPEFDAPQPTVRIRLAELLPLLTIAHRHNYLWLQDFLDDEVMVTDDLYEVLRAFRCQRRPSA